MVKANAYNHGIDGVAYIAKNIVDRFEFSICDQNTFKQKLGLEVAE